MTGDRQNVVRFSTDIFTETASMEPFERERDSPEMSLQFSSFPESEWSSAQTGHGLNHSLLATGFIFK